MDVYLSGGSIAPLIGCILLSLSGVLFFVFSQFSLYRKTVIMSGMFLFSIGAGVGYLSSKELLEIKNNNFETINGKIIDYVETTNIKMTNGNSDLKEYTNITIRKKDGKQIKKTIKGYNKFDTNMEYEIKVFIYNNEVYKITQKDNS